jgi:hypothetical protein
MNINPRTEHVKGIRSVYEKMQPDHLAKHLTKMIHGELPKGDVHQFVKENHGDLRSMMEDHLNWLHTNQDVTSDQEVADYHQHVRQIMGPETTDRNWLADYESLHRHILPVAAAAAPVAAEAGAVTAGGAGAGMGATLGRGAAASEGGAAGGLGRSLTEGAIGSVTQGSTAGKGPDGGSAASPTGKAGKGGSSSPFDKGVNATVSGIQGLQTIADQGHQTYMSDDEFYRELDRHHTDFKMDKTAPTPTPKGEPTAHDSETFAHLDPNFKKPDYNGEFGVLPTVLAPTSRDRTKDTLASVPHLHSKPDWLYGDTVTKGKPHVPQPRETPEESIASWKGPLPMKLRNDDDGDIEFYAMLDAIGKKAAEMKAEPSDDPDKGTKRPLAPHEDAFGVSRGGVHKGWGETSNLMTPSHDARLR